MTTERWLPVPGFETLYTVSDIGRVKRSLTSPGSYAGRLLKATPSQGYPRVSLMKAKRRSDQFVHVLVMATFVGPRPADHQIHHRDGDRSNPRLDNLEYLLKSEHWRVTALSLICRGEAHHNAKLTEDDVREIRAAKCTRNPADKQWQRLADRFGVSIHTIRGVRERSSWKHVT